MSVVSEQPVLTGAVVAAALNLPLAGLAAFHVWVPDGSEYGFIATAIAFLTFLIGAITHRYTTPWPLTNEARASIAPPDASPPLPRPEVGKT